MTFMNIIIVDIIVDIRTRMYVGGQATFNSYHCRSYMCQSYHY